MIPVPHEEAGHLLVLFLAADSGQVIDVPALRGVLAERLPKYMLPESVQLRASLPRGPTGKIDRKALLLEATQALGPQKP